MESKITVLEAINRGNNLLAVALMSITSATLIERLIGEDDMIDKIDEAIIILLGVTALIWYLSQNNRFKRSFVPLGILIGAALVQIGGLVAEIGDPAAAGDDYGLVIFFVLAVILNSVIYYRTRQLAAQPQNVSPANPGNLSG